MRGDDDCDETTPDPALTCEYYCSLSRTTCMGADYPFADTEECMTYCAGAVLGTCVAGPADTIGCRAAYLETRRCYLAGPDSIICSG